MASYVDGGVSWSNDESSWWGDNPLQSPPLTKAFEIGDRIVDCMQNEYKSCEVIMVSKKVKVYKYNMMTQEVSSLAPCGSINEEMRTLAVSLDGADEKLYILVNEKRQYPFQITCGGTRKLIGRDANKYLVIESEERNRMMGIEDEIKSIQNRLDHFKGQTLDFIKSEHSKCKQEINTAFQKLRESLDRRHSVLLERLNDIVENETRKFEHKSAAIVTDNYSGKSSHNLSRTVDLLWTDTPTIQTTMRSIGIHHQRRTQSLIIMNLQDFSFECHSVDICLEQDEVPMSLVVDGILHLFMYMVQEDTIIHLRWNNAEKRFDEKEKVHTAGALKKGHTLVQVPSRGSLFMFGDDGVLCYSFSHQHWTNVDLKVAQGMVFVKGLWVEQKQCIVLFHRYKGIYVVNVDTMSCKHVDWVKHPKRKTHFNVLLRRKTFLHALLISGFTRNVDGIFVPVEIGQFVFEYLGSEDSFILLQTYGGVLNRLRLRVHDIFN